MPTRKLPSCSLNTTDCDVGLVDDRVDDRELRCRGTRPRSSRAGSRRRSRPRRRCRAALRHAAQRLLALALVGDLELEIGDAGLLLELLGAVVGGLVERLVELAAHVEDDRGLEVLGGLRRSRGQRQGERQARRAGSAFPTSSDPGAPTVERASRRNATGYRRRAQPGRGAAARRSRSRIASPSPSAGIGMTAIRRPRCVELAQHGEQVARGLGQVARRAEIAAPRAHPAGGSGPNASSASSGPTRHCIEAQRQAGRVVAGELAGRARRRSVDVAVRERPRAAAPAPSRVEPAGAQQSAARRRSGRRRCSRRRPGRGRRRARGRRHRPARLRRARRVVGLTRPDGLALGRRHAAARPRAAGLGPRGATGTRTATCREPAVAAGAIGPPARPCGRTSVSGPGQNASASRRRGRRTRRWRGRRRDRRHARSADCAPGAPWRG